MRQVSSIFNLNATSDVIFFFMEGILSFYFECFKKQRISTCIVSGKTVSVLIEDGIMVVYLRDSNFVSAFLISVFRTIT